MMKRIEYQLRRCIYDDVAYTPKLAGYLRVSDINKLDDIMSKRLMRGMPLMVEIGNMKNPKLER